MRFIELTQGQRTTVDDKDYPFLAQWKWYAIKTRNGWYAARRKGLFEKGGKTVFMHNQLSKRMNLLIPEGSHVDHADRNGLNNTRKNLRVATHSENNINTGLLPTNTSGYKGVSWNKNSQRWDASIIYQGRSFNIGASDSKEYAARLYDYAAKKLFGNFAYLNFPNDIISFDRKLDAKVALVVENKPIPPVINKPKRNKSGYFGVCWRIRSQNWHAQISYNNKKIHIGYFSDIIQAARAFDRKAIEIYGDLATTNFPIEEYI